MNSETRTCQNCKQNFTIESEDSDFYKKIDVPPPTWCPECRMVRRLLHRNETAWYHRICDATGKKVISMYASEVPIKIYEQTYWRGDAWDPLSYGRQYDFSKPFFKQFKELFYDIPHPNLIQRNNVNSEYTNYTLNLKNCYLVGGSDTAEDSAYMFGSNVRIKDCFDTYRISDLEQCYEVIDCEKCNNIFFCQDCIGCNDSMLLYDCRNCSYCFGCVGLRGKQYHIFNTPYSKEEYHKEVARLDPKNFKNFLGHQERFEELMQSIPRKFASILKSTNVVGNDIIGARNCYYCFSARNDIENCRYSYRVLDHCKDGHDAFVAWNNSELFYEVFSITGQRIKDSVLIWGGFDIYYSYLCFDCHDIFGCFGLRNKSYCILNKQYTEKEYRELLLKIIKQMADIPYRDAEGRVYGYGEFFPPDLSPFAYNETVAQGYFPKTRAEAVARGFGWREREARDYHITKQPDELPDTLDIVDDSIVNEVIGCVHAGNCDDGCSTAFRIIPTELQFLRKNALSLPRLCPICRRARRLKARLPLKLWHRKCQCIGAESESGIYQNSAEHFHSRDHCPNEFETPYAPDRPEIVYCEACYQREIL